LRLHSLVGVFSIVILLLAVGCTSTPTYQQGPLGKYFVDFRDVAQHWDGPFDEQGIPLRDYGGNIGVQYQPVGIAQYALGNWDLWLETYDDQYRQKFFKIADWFCKNLVDKGDFGVWEYQFDYPRFHLKAPWPSAMSQGEGISVLARAYQLTQDKRYLQCAQKALEAFKFPITRGGVRYQDEKGFVWYEEYPSPPPLEPPHVLNGFIFALFGVYDFYKITGSDEALRLFMDGITTLKVNLWRYDLGFWSRYDLTDLYGGQFVYLFRFVTDKKHPKYSHPVDTIVLRAVTDDGTDKIKVTLDVGSKDDTKDLSLYRTRLYFSPEFQDWGDPYVLDGRSVRNYENRGGHYAHAPFEFVVKLLPLTYYLDVTYKDISKEPIYVEMWVGIWGYVRFGKLISNGDGAWKTVTLEIPQQLMMSREATSFTYHRLHIKQLKALHEITNEHVFQKYARIFDEYYRLVRK